MTNLKIKSGFSIAEALTTMLIVSLIILMTMPLFSQKKQRGSGYTGKWECRIDSATGTVESVSETAGVGRVGPDGKSCIFTPPKSARNFSVNVIGGGGGGAAASTEADAFVVTSGMKNFIPEYTGLYTIVLVGGGGAGGCTECGYGPARGGGLGGGAGGVSIMKDVTLKKDAVYVLEVGNGGVITNQHSQEADGVIGNPTYFHFPDGSSMSALPGTGGFGGHHQAFHGKKCVPNDGWRSKGVGGKNRTYLSGSSFSTSGPTSMQNALKNTSDNYSTSNRPNPGYVCDSSGTCITNELTKLLGSSASYTVGRGGWGATRDDTCGQPGKNGLAMVKFSGLYGGGGGDGGTHTYKNFKKLPAEVVVRVGVGGKGGIEENSDGEPGTSSAFGNLTAGGGAGGRVKAVVGPATQPLAGASGGASPFGGILSGGFGSGNSLINGLNNMETNNGIVATSEDMYGAGGGGGGAKDKTQCSVSDGYKGCWGQGGHGVNGIVRVEWN